MLLSVWVVSWVYFLLLKRNGFLDFSVSVFWFISQEMNISVFMEKV